MTFEELAAQASAMAAASKAFVAEHRDEIIGESADGSRAAALINQIAAILPSFEMALLERARELAPPAEVNFAGPTSSGVMVLSGGPHDGHEHFDDGNWELGSIREIGDPPFHYRRTGLDTAEAVDAAV